MKDKINRLARGIMDAEAPEIRLMPEQFSDVLPAGGCKHFDIDIESPDGSNLKGLCYCDHPRVELETRIFVGRRSHISLRVDTSGCERGAEIDGRIALITNAGEFSIPYHFAVTASAASGGTGNVALDAEAGTEERGISAEETEGLMQGGEQAAPGTSSSDTSLDPVLQISSPYLAFLAAHFPEDNELMSSLCALLIREDAKDAFAFCAYREAVRRGLTITRLYESYVCAFPEGYEEEIPRQILFYFSFDNTLPPGPRAVVYRDVLLHADPDSELYRIYEPQIRAFSMECMFEGRIDACIAVLYDRMIYPDMIDQKAAKRLPDLLKSCRIVCAQRNMRNVIIHYPELETEERYAGRDGVFYAPVYFDNAVISFEDAYGRRYTKLDYMKKQLLQKPGLLRRCFSLVPYHPMLKLSAAREIAKKGILEETQKQIVCDVLKTLPLSVPMQERLVEKLCAYGGSLDWLPLVDMENIGPDARQAVVTCLIHAGEMQKALELLRAYGFEIAGALDRSRLVIEMIRTGNAPVSEGEANPFFLSLCRNSFDEGEREPLLLAFMTKYYESSTEDMYEVMLAAEQGLAPLYELPEKILAAKLFAGTRTHIDETFVRYVRCCRQQEVIVRAYFTVRSTDYFSAGQDVARETFEALYSYINAADDAEKLPSIYLLALTKHYASRETLLPDELLLCQKLTDLLIADGLVFHYTKQLSQKISVPEEICERYYIEYHGRKEAPPKLFVKLGVASFQQEEMTRVYQGIYVWSTVLFLADELTYRIYDGAHADEPAEEGQICVKKLHTGGSGRYAMLNRMMCALLSGDVSALKEEMQDYLLQDKINRALFTVRE